MEVKVLVYGWNLRVELTQQIIIIIEASFGSGLRWDAGMIPPCLAFRV